MEKTRLLAMALVDILGLCVAGPQLRWARCLEIVVSVGDGEGRIAQLRCRLRIE